MPPARKNVKVVVRMETPEPISTYAYINSQLTRMSYIMAAGGFAGIALLQLTAALVSSTLTADNALGASVCAIASAHYTWMRTNPCDVTLTRFSDWYLTTTLMLIEFFSLSGTLLTRPVHFGGACLANLAMLAFGNVAAIIRERKCGGGAYTPYFICSCMCFLILIGLFASGTYVDSHPSPWMYGFAGLWVLYPVAFWCRSDLAYNLLDLVSKGAFGVTVASIALLG